MWPEQFQSSGKSYCTDTVLYCHIQAIKQRMLCVKISPIHDCNRLLCTGFTTLHTSEVQTSESRDTKTRPNIKNL